MDNTYDEQKNGEENEGDDEEDGRIFKEEKDQEAKIMDTNAVQKAFEKIEEYRKWNALCEAEKLRYQGIISEAQRKLDEMALLPAKIGEQVAVLEQVVQAKNNEIERLKRQSDTAQGQLDTILERIEGGERGLEGLQTTIRKKMAELSAIEASIAKKVSEQTKSSSKVEKIKKEITSFSVLRADIERECKEKTQESAQLSIDVAMLEKKKEVLIRQNAVMKAKLNK